LKPLKPSNEASQAESRWLDRIAPLSAVCVLLFSCVVSSAHKDMWPDEGFTLQLLTDHSLLHMMRALAHAADGGMPLYYLLAYGWGRLFGVSLLSLRLLSSLFVCAGVLLLWSTLRRAYSLMAVCLGITVTTLTSVLVLTQNAQARYYGFYFACAALVFALHFRISHVSRPGWKLLTVAIAANAALIMSHPFGIFYSLVAIYALLFSDYRWGKLRLRLYLTLASSWLILLLWIRPMIQLHDVAVPHNWLPPLTPSDVLSFYSLSSPCLVFSILTVIALTALGHPTDDTHPASQSSLSLLTCGIAYLIPPLIIAGLSTGESSFFLNRYFMPSLIGIATVLTSLFDSRLRRVQSGVALKVAWISLFVLFLGWPVGSAEKLEDKRLLAIDQGLPAGLPVVVTDAQMFLPLTYLSRKPSRPYYYPLDWDAALQSPNSGMTVEYKLMRNARESGYSTDRILEAKELLCTFDTFIVLDTPELEWFQARLARNRDYSVQLLGDAPHGLRVWSVRRVGNDTCR
jgi:hypothetical protein